MTASQFVRSLPLVSALAVSACAPAKKSGGASTAATASVARTEARVDASADPDAFGLPPLAFGPYPLAPPPPGDAQLSVEYGYVDLRRQDGARIDELFDFRWKFAAALTSPGHLPEPLSGCAVVEEKSYAAGGADAVRVEGFTERELEAESGGAFVWEDTGKASSVIDTKKALTASATTGGQAQAEVTGGVVPLTGLVTLGVAYDGTLNMNLLVRTLSDALASSEDKLNVRAAAGEYDVAVVTLIGAGSAEARALRCVLPAGGSASLAPAQYKQVLPLRGFYLRYARVASQTSGDVVTWVAAVAGEGAYDRSTP